MVQLHWLFAVKVVWLLGWGEDLVWLQFSGVVLLWGFGFCLGVVDWDWGGWGGDA